MNKIIIVYILFQFIFLKNTWGQENPDYYIEKTTDSLVEFKVYRNNVLYDQINRQDSKDSEVIIYSEKGVIDGPMLEFENRHIKSASFFKNGLLIGTELYFNKNGKPVYIVNRDNEGNLDGMLFEFNEFGELSLIYSYCKGKMIGILFNGKNKGFSPPPGKMNAQDSTAWRLNIGNSTPPR